METQLVIPEMITATFGLAVFLLGAKLTRRFAILREFNIPEPVTGGLLAAALFAAAPFSPASLISRAHVQGLNDKTMGRR